MACRCGRHSHPPNPWAILSTRQPTDCLAIVYPGRALFLWRWLRSVRRSVRTQSGTDQVCGAKQRQVHAVHPPLEQQATTPLPIHFWWCTSTEINQPLRPSIPADYSALSRLVGRFPSSPTRFVCSEWPDGNRKTSSRFNDIDSHEAVDDVLGMRLALVPPLWRTAETATAGAKRLIGGEL